MEKEMKAKMILCLAIGLLIACFTSLSVAKVSAAGDTIYITGGTLAGGENAGSFETAINGDTTTGARLNVNRVYALYEGQVYFQKASLNVYNPTGMLTIVGVPDPANPSVTTKPIIIITPTGSVNVGIGANNAAVNQLYGSLKIVNVHYQTMQTNGFLNNELFFLGTQGTLPQELIVDNCLFEFSKIDLFDATNEQNAIGGWPYGAKFKITNSYFRNMMAADQWWNSRVFQCKHPIDTLWLENNTVTTGGLTFLQQNQLTDFAYINHNTIVNNKKYWLLSHFYHELYITNNIFLNQNWVGEDTNVTSSGQDPDKSFQSTIDIDSVSSYHGVIVQPKYYSGDSTHYSSALDLNRLKIFVSNNINYYDPRLTTGYYNNATYLLADTGSPAQPFNAIPSYLAWSTPAGMAQKVGNMPCAWMNSRTLNLFATYGPGNGGFIEEYTITNDPGTVTPAIADASVVDEMAKWNQNMYGDPRFTSSTIMTTGYIYGDYNPQTLPGIVGSTKSDAITAETAGTQVGIRKFTDLTENFSHSGFISNIDGFPIGSLIWDDTQNAAYAAAHAGELAIVLLHYGAHGGFGVDEKPLVVTEYSLLQNYPNPFNPTTTINFTLAKASDVKLSVYNVLGQKVITLVDSRMSAGQQSIVFDASKLTSGVYFYHLDIGSFSSVKKMLLLK